MRADVIAIGDELTTGQRLDTNSQWIAREAGFLGIAVGFHTTVPDDLGDGVRALREAAGRADLVFVTGGLGPTADDLTRDVLAAVAGEPLEERAEALAAIAARFAKRGVAMAESNRRQALFPRGSRLIPNPEGTAPGLDVDVGTAGRSCRVFALPGVPAEMKRMWRDTVVPALVAATGGGTMVFRRIKCFGRGESAIEALLPDLVARGRDPLVGITAHAATITLRIAARGADEAECRARIAPTERIIRECLGGLVFGVEDDEVEDAALAALAAAGGALVTVEGGTCGALAELAAAAGARRGDGLFRGAEVLPATTAIDVLVAAAAAGRRQRGASHALVVGPVEREDGSDTVEIVLLGPGDERRKRHRLGGDSTIRLSWTARTALDLVRTTLGAGAAVPPPGPAGGVR